MRKREEIMKDVETIVNESLEADKLPVEEASKKQKHTMAKVYVLFAEYLLDIRDILDNIGDALATTVTRIHGEEE